MKEALYYEKTDNNKVVCHLCPNECTISENNIGACLNRKNVDGKLYSLNYGRVTAVSVDPIEKKPLYHFYPGADAFSLGTSGCSLKCDFCQNYDIAYSGPEITKPLSPKQCIDTAKNEGYDIIAYTYNEPFIWYEHIIECCKLAKKHGIQNVLVTNGYYNVEPFKELLPYIDAMNIDLKSFNDSFYKKVCKGKIEPVKETIKLASKKTHVEITTLIIPELNDKKEELVELIDFVKEINEEIPFHISRYFPRFKRTTPPTSEKTLELAYKLAKEKLKHVYVGNIGGFDNNTYCANCGNTLITRNFYNTQIVGLKGSTCNNCDYTLFGKYI